MATGYLISNGTDLDNVFDPYVQGASPAQTGYKLSNGADINTRYAPLSFGSAAATTGYKISSGVDINTLFAAKGTAIYINTGWNGTENYARVTQVNTNEIWCIAISSFSIRRDGTWLISSVGSLGTAGLVATTPDRAGDWIGNKTSDIGDGYEFRMTLTNLSPTVGSVTTQNQMSGWTPITANRRLLLQAEVPAGISETRFRRVNVLVEARAIGSSSITSSNTIIEVRAERF